MKRRKKHDRYLTPADRVMIKNLDHQFAVLVVFVILYLTGMAYQILSE